MGILKERFNIQDLKRIQREGITAILNGTDLFVGCKTGSGKSLIYECIPLLIPDSSVLVIAPLQSIMKEQTERLQKLGFSAMCVGDEEFNDPRLTKMECDFLFGSPEALLGDRKWRERLQTPEYQRKIKLIVVDEAHTIVQWGIGSKDEEPFREWFSRIGELRSICPKVPIAALTATSSASQRRTILNKLCFSKHSEVIAESPDRENIKITSVQVPNNEDLHTTFGWLIDGLKAEKESFPRHVIFSETILTVSKIYSAFVDVLGSDCKYVNMFHSKTKETLKEEIRKDMTQDGLIRVLICTNSAGMGVNYSFLRNVVHYGLPHKMDTFVQQMGRAGRTGELSNELILFKLHKGMLKKVDTDLVQLAKDTQCRRKVLCNSYLCIKDDINPVHNCCDVCEKECQCGGESCPATHPARMERKIYCPSMERTVSDQERVLLRDKLRALKFSLSISNTLLSSELMHGLTDDVIEDIVAKSDKLFSPYDILATMPIWSYEFSEKICTILSDVFGDIEMYDFDDSNDSD
uniref:DNA 3'-5' helicase n=2 Tax=Magallana gigas TaxID=29159 RepID=A0A8W8N9U5_MAGGI